MLRPRDKYALCSQNKASFRAAWLHTKRKTCTANLSYELRSDQQNANAQLIQCTYAAFPYQTLWSILRPCLNVKLVCMRAFLKIKILMELSGCKLFIKRVYAWGFVHLSDCMCVYPNKCSEAFLYIFHTQQLLCHRSMTKHIWKCVNILKRLNRCVPFALLTHFQQPFHITRLGTKAPLPSLQLQRELTHWDSPLNQIKHFQ